MGLHDTRVKTQVDVSFFFFKLYLSRCPGTAPADVFYLRPLDKPKTEAWYFNQAIGHNKHTTCTTVVRLCKAANIEGFKTNHSLRTTTATRLYHSNHDEQLIMERTGHRSIEGIRNYKRTSERQHQAVSQLLNNASVDDHCTNQSIPPGPLALIAALYISTNLETRKPLHSFKQDVPTTDLSATALSTIYSELLL